MNFKFLLTTSFFFIFIITSCGNKTNIENIADKQSYINQIEKLSDTDRKKQLERDAALLQQTIDNIGDLHIYFSFSFSMGGSSINTDIDTAQAFSIAPQEAYLKDFVLLKNSEILTEQNFVEGKADFNIYSISSEFKTIDRSGLKYIIKEAYRNGKQLNSNDNYLSAIDSLDVIASYSYPLAFDTITFSQGVDSVLYNGQTIDVESSDDKTIEIEYPIYLNVLGYRAINEDGVLMDKTSNSSFPITGISPVVTQEIKNAINLLKQASQAENKNESIGYIEKISDKTFSNISLMVELEKEYNGHKSEKEDDTDSQIDYIKSLMEKYAQLFAFTKQSLNLTFPMPYKQVYLYVATKTDTISTEIKVIPSNDEILKYNVFSDSTKTKYGIVDNDGKIIMPASYSSIIQYDTLYFNVKENDKDAGKYLNPQTLKFESLPANTRFKQQLAADISVFSDNNNYLGVLKNNKTEVIPFKYNNIYKIGKTIVAEASKRGRPYYHFYTLDGKQMNTPFIKDINANQKAGDIIIRSDNNKDGYINNQAVMTISPQYKYIDRIGKNLLLFSDNNSDLVGLLDNNGNIILRPQFYYVGPLIENRILFRIDDNSRGSYINNERYGYLNENGQVVIEPKFSFAENFHKGYALIRVNDIYYLIDKDANVIKTFDAEYVDMYQTEDSDRDNPDFYYETSNGIEYNYKGELLK